MRFPGFYGNAALKKRLSTTLANRGLTHCYILSGPTGSGKKTLAKILAAAMECTGEGERPCGVCPACHKIFGGGHPDVITISDPGGHASVPVNIIREKLVADAYIRPNEGARKVYLLPQELNMQPAAQNALLKILEEPPAYCCFIIMTDNAEKLLSTIRSRAVELNLFPLSDADLKNALLQRADNPDSAVLAAAAEKSGGYLGAALKLLEDPQALQDSRLSPIADALSTGDNLTIMSALVPFEKLKRPEYLSLMTDLSQLLVQASKKQSGAAGFYSADAEKLADRCSQAVLYHTVNAVNQVISMLQANGNVGLCSGYLLSELSSAGMKY